MTQASKTPGKGKREKPSDLNTDLERFSKDSRSKHEAEEGAKTLDGRERDVRRRQERADKDNETSR